MALLAWIFIRYLFAPYLPAEQLNSYVAGLILLAAAPCTAMVFVWSRLTGGDPYFTLSQVALNDAIMIFLRAYHRPAARPVRHRWAARAGVVPRRARPEAVASHARRPALKREVMRHITKQ